MCLLSRVTYTEAIFPVGIIKKVIGEKRQGGGVVPTPPPLVVRGLTIAIRIMFVFEVKLLYKISYRYVFGVRESNGNNETIPF